MVLLGRLQYPHLRRQLHPAAAWGEGYRIWSLFDYHSTICITYFSIYKHYIPPHWTAVPCCPLRVQVLVWFTWENLSPGRHFGRHMCFVDPDWVKMSSICFGSLRSFCGASRSAIPSVWPFCQVIRGLFCDDVFEIFCGKTGETVALVCLTWEIGPPFFARLCFLKWRDRGLCTFHIYL